MSEDRPIKSSAELPEPKLVEGDWKFWQGYYMLARTMKHADGTETHEDGGFVPHNGYLWLAIAEDGRYGFGWSKQDAKDSAQLEEIAV